MILVKITQQNISSKKHTKFVQTIALAKHADGMPLYIALKKRLTVKQILTMCSESQKTKIGKRKKDQGVIIITDFTG